MQINKSGLMRCCIKTLRDRPTTSGYQLEGTILQCDYCNSSMILGGEVWRWAETDARVAKVASVTARGTGTSNLITQQDRD